MIATTKKAQYFEQHDIPTEGGDALRAKLMLPKRSGPPSRLVCIAPLVGSSASQALIIFRSLTRRGTAIMSFEYRGHAASSGTFELDKVLVDTRHALEWASAYARDLSIPLHGMATCFGNVALLSQFAGGAPACPLRSLSAVSGLFRLDQVLRFERFAPGSWR
jgi:hypothetical protein